MNEYQVTKQQLEIMLHTLGLGDPYRKESYRNYFVAGNGHCDLPEITALISIGLMEEQAAPRFLDGGSRVFCVTEKGISYCLTHRKRPSKAKRMYHTYLEISDCDSDLTFKQFLTDPEYAESRKNA